MKYKQYYTVIRYRVSLNKTCRPHSENHYNVSGSADLAYTYGKYIWKFLDEKGDTIKGSISYCLETTAG